jgi:signal transduction histidine kinase
VTRSSADQPPPEQLAASVASDLSASPLFLTLSTLIFPTALHWGFDAVAGATLALIGAPMLGAVWALISCTADWVLQRTYRRWLASGAKDGDGRGLLRLATLCGARAALWMAGPVLMVLTAHSAAALVITAVTALGVVAIGVSVGWTSRAVFIATFAPVALAITVIGAVLLPPLAAAGVLLGVASFSATMTLITFGTHKAVSQWADSHAQTVALVADLKAALKRSEAAERRLRIAVGIVDLHVYEVNYANKTLESLGAEGVFFENNFTYEQMAADPYYAVHPDDRAASVAAWEKHETEGQPYRTEYRVKRSDGQEVWAFAAAEVIHDENGRPLTLVGALHDITERKRSLMDLTAARDLAEAGSQAKSDFLATMSHEIRTPLNGVLGMVQAMNRDDLSTLQRTRLNVIQQSGEILLSLLNNSLDFSKIEAGKLELEVGEVDVGKVVREVADAFSALASEKDLNVSVRVTPGAAGIYRGDAIRVSQILYNLTSNAVKFTERGAVTVEADRTGDTLTIRVSDTGIGIAEDQRSALFQQFVQADASTTRRFGGTGLGLTIARHLARLMGGDIALESRLGEGTVFIVSLPLERLGEAAGDEAATELAPALEIDDAPALRVLAAEDNLINQLVLTTLLHQFGIDPVIVADGVQAVEAWRSGRWDLILMDVQMPNMDGPTATRQIRKEELAGGRAPTPILGLTANVMHDQVASYRAAGMNDVIAKPIEVGALLAAISACLEAQGSESAGERAA